MEAKSSKKELYLQRLATWRAERDSKKKPLAEIKGNKQITVSSHVKGKSKEIPPQKQIVKPMAKQKLALEARTHKSVTPSQPKETNTTASQESKKYIAVKSRLFDYLNKPVKNVPIKKPSDNVVVTLTETKSNVQKHNKDTKPIASVKCGQKRRQSEVSHAPPKKPAGILKRKSCIPSIESIGDSGANQVISDVNVNAGLKENDDVFLTTASVRKDIPVAMVTPGMARSVRFISPSEKSENHGAKLRKTPLKPAEMRDHLSGWLKAKGRTPSKFRHLMCFHDELEEEKSQEPQTKPSLSVEELSEQMDVIQFEEIEAKAQEKLNTMLDECMTLFDAGCPVEDILPWLDDIYTKIPQAKTSSRFYECKANVIKFTLDLDSLLEIFELAYINNAQPREQLAKVLSESIKYVNGEQLRAARKRKGTPRRSGIQEENMFQSSAIVYTVSEVTPFSDSKSTKTTDSTAGETCKVITPVRRSTRRSLQNLPSSLKDKKDMYRSLVEMDETKRDNMLFQPNLALDNLLAQAEGN